MENTKENVHNKVLQSNAKIYFNGFENAHNKVQQRNTYIIEIYFNGFENYSKMLILFFKYFFLLVLSIT